MEFATFDCVSQLIKAWLRWRKVRCFEGSTRTTRSHQMVAYLDVFFLGFLLEFVFKVFTAVRGVSQPVVAQRGASKGPLASTHFVVA